VYNKETKRSCEADMKYEDTSGLMGNMKKGKRGEVRTAAVNRANKFKSVRCGVLLDSVAFKSISPYF
jgi:hypothetical protein